MRLSQGSGQIKYAVAPGTVSGASGTYGFVTTTTPSFLFDGAIPADIANSWTRSYNIYSTQGASGSYSSSGGSVSGGSSAGVGTAVQMEKSPDAAIFGEWPGQTTQYSFNNTPIRAFGESVTKTTGYKKVSGGWA